MLLTRREVLQCSAKLQIYIHHRADKMFERVQKADVHLRLCCTWLRMLMVRKSESLSVTKCRWLSSSFPQSDEIAFAKLWGTPHFQVSVTHISITWSCISNKRNFAIFFYDFGLTSLHPFSTLLGPCKWNAVESGLAICTFRCCFGGSLQVDWVIDQR